jgi:polyphosphate kinase
LGKYKYFNREISWLAFNHRVLQEAYDPSVPLYERIKFMAIFSSNLDEFYRVRVAALRNLLELKKKTQKKLSFEPALLLKDIYKKVHEQQEQLGDIYRNNILPELIQNKINLIQDTDLENKQAAFVKDFFAQEVRPHIQPTLLLKNKVTLFLQNKSIYLAIKLLSLKQTKDKQAKYTKYAILEIPSWEQKFIMFLDDVIRFCSQDIFPGYIVDEMYSFKLTRDAEIYIDDEFSGNLLEKIKKGISKRKIGLPCRFLYDLHMPKDFLRFLKEAFVLSNEDLMLGGRYHNFNDFFHLPNLGPKRLENKSMPPLHVTALDSAKVLFTVIKQKDYLLYYPYHSYTYVIRFLKEAALDKKVVEIFITLYRVASDSQVIKNLILAAKHGKSVTVFVELKARFDEESNIKWAEELETAGVKVLYSFPGLKVHSKLCLVRRKELQSIINYCYLASGNFNEGTAALYTDIGFFTADPNITKEVYNAFQYLSQKGKMHNYQHLMVAPFNMRESFYILIENEIKNALKGKKAEIILKVNSLQDKKIINKLYQASNTGVQIKIIVRGICCLMPGIEGMSENIEAISIIDRFLEHSRIYIFYNGGKRKYFVASADWMQRNLNRRIEVAFPIYNQQIKDILQNIINIQLNDTVKARIIDKSLKNCYQQAESAEKTRSQMETYQYLQKLTKD